MPKKKSKAILSKFTSGSLRSLQCRLSPSRLVKKIRAKNDPSAGTVLTKDWDFNIEEKDAEFLDDLREASGVGRRRRRKGVSSTCNKDRIFFSFMV